MLQCTGQGSWPKPSRGGCGPAPRQGRRLSDAAVRHRRLSGPGRVEWPLAMRSSKWTLAAGASTSIDRVGRRPVKRGSAFRPLPSSAHAWRHGAALKACLSARRSRCQSLNSSPSTRAAFDPEAAGRLSMGVSAALRLHCRRNVRPTSLARRQVISASKASPERQTRNINGLEKLSGAPNRTRAPDLLRSRMAQSTVRAAAP